MKLRDVLLVLALGLMFSLAGVAVGAILGEVFRMSNGG